MLLVIVIYIYIYIYHCTLYYNHASLQYEYRSLLSLPNEIQSYQYFEMHETIFHPFVKRISIKNNK